MLRRQRRTSAAQHNPPCAPGLFSPDAANAGCSRTPARDGRQPQRRAVAGGGVLASIRFFD